jgi:hypothetical protein
LLGCHASRFSLVIPAFTGMTAMGYIGVLVDGDQDADCFHNLACDRVDDRSAAMHPMQRYRITERIGAMLRRWRELFFPLALVPIPVRKENSYARRCVERRELP